MSYTREESNDFEDPILFYSDKYPANEAIIGLGALFVFFAVLAYLFSAIYRVPFHILRYVSEALIIRHSDKKEAMNQVDALAATNVVAFQSQWAWICSCGTPLCTYCLASWGCFTTVSSLASICSLLSRDQPICATFWRLFRNQGRKVCWFCFCSSLLNFCSLWLLSQATSEMCLTTCASLCSLVS